MASIQRAAVSRGNFREVIQSFWFTFLMALPSPTTSAGLTSICTPTTRAISPDRITDDKVAEYLRSCAATVMKINRVRQGQPGKNAGQAKWYN